MRVRSSAKQRTGMIQELFNSDDLNENGHFDRVLNKLSEKRDLHAFILMGKLFPGHEGIIAGSNHEQIFFNHPPMDELEKLLSEDQAIELIRCGVFYDSYAGGLTMFV